MLGKASKVRNSQSITKRLKRAVNKSYSKPSLPAFRRKIARQGETKTKPSLLPPKKGRLLGKAEKQQVHPKPSLPASRRKIARQGVTKTKPSLLTPKKGRLLGKAEKQQVHSKPSLPAFQRKIA